jgi:hypothetical protein
VRGFAPVFLGSYRNWQRIEELQYMLRVSLRSGRRFAPSFYVGAEGPTPKEALRAVAFAAGQEAPPFHRESFAPLALGRNLKVELLQKRFYLR